MTTYLIHAQNKTYSVKVDYPTITEADKPLEKFVGEKLRNADLLERLVMKLTKILFLTSKTN